MGVDVTKLALDVDDPFSELAAVALELSLTRAAQTDAADTLPGEVGPESGQTWQTIFELRQLDLEPPLMRGRATGEHVKDERRAIDDFDIERPLQVALLSGSEIVVDHDYVVANVVAAGFDLLELPLADVGAG